MNVIKKAFLPPPILTANPTNIVQKLATNDGGMPPNVQKLLAKYGDSPIKFIKINRQPVAAGMTSMLNVFSKNQSNLVRS
jgi:hypothetical protein